MTMDKAELPGPAAPVAVPLCSRICFLLNDEQVAVDAPPATLVLDFLRRRGGLAGTKEGCREGDCGACAVLVGELDAEGALRYRSMTSCLMPLVELNGKHLVTIEGLDLGRPSPVQQKIVDAGASQCGFCTPGIVLSLTGMMLEGSEGTGSLYISDAASVPEATSVSEAKASPSDRATFSAAESEASEPAHRELARVERALSGHLCRCTGYRSLRQAGLEILSAGTEANLEGPELQGSSIERLVDAGWLPSGFQDAKEKLAGLHRDSLNSASEGEDSARETAADGAVILAGGTDLYVQQGDDLALSMVRSLGLEPDLKVISMHGSQLEIGAQVTFEGLAESEDFRRLVPDVDRFMHWIASLQLRHRASLGGNLVNASPIGDVTVLMLALGARVRCRHRGVERELALRSLYLGYKELDLASGELVSHVLLDAETISRRQVDFQKVSKRKCLDIATVNSGMSIRVKDEHIVELDLAVGGVAPIPLYLKEVSELGIGLPLNVDTVRKLVRVTQQQIAPIDDVRGSADYKRLLCGQLQIAHFLDLFPGVFTDASPDVSPAETLLSETFLSESDDGSSGR